MGAISAWTINVQTQLADKTPVFEKVLPQYTLQAYNTGDSFWIVCTWPKGGRVAFRAAFALSGTFSDIKVKAQENTVRFDMETALAHYEVSLKIHNSAIPLFHYTTTIRPLAPMLIPYWPRDIVPLTQTGKIENTIGKIHSRQIGARTGQMFISVTRPATGSVFYFQNLTALGDYCDATQTSAAESVGGEWPEMGYQVPAAKTKPLPASRFVVSDAYIIPDAVIPENSFDIAQQYINHLSTVYLEIPKPPTAYRDWPRISKKSISDLTHNKGCWTYADGHAYLNAYLCDYKTPPEIMVQLAVLDALTDYSQWSGESYPVIDEIYKGLSAFYDAKLQTISRWLPSMRDNLDESEEQKKAMTMDSWYLYHPLMNLSKFALKGDKAAEKLVMDSVEYAIKVAHLFDYQWPVFYKMDTLEVLKEETAPGQGGEKDVAGGYALLMLNLWKLTHEKRYFNEATKAIRKMAGFDAIIFYQANITSFAALACLRIYRETKDPFYLDTSYLCLAGILNNVQLWESEYGNSKYFPDFYGIFPLKDAPYRAAYEELEVFAALDDYVKEAAAAGIKILPGLTILLPELIKYGAHRLPFYYPPMLPKSILSDEVKTGQTDPSLWIPLEDLYDGWEKNGKVGQEVYGAGIGFGVVPRQYIKIPEGHFMLYTDYPICDLETGNRSVAFRIIGDSRLECKVIAIPDSEQSGKKFTLTIKQGEKDTEIPCLKKSKNHAEFKANGNAKLTLKW
jgi:hypothetical protein